MTPHETGDSREGDAPSVRADGTIDPYVGSDPQPAEAWEVAMFEGAPMEEVDRLLAEQRAAERGGDEIAEDASGD